MIIITVLSAFTHAPWLYSYEKDMKDKSSLTIINFYDNFRKHTMSRLRWKIRPKVVLKTGKKYSNRARIFEKVLEISK